MPQKRLIICCAPAGVGTGANLGMQTVDFAAHNLVERLELTDRAEIHRPWEALSKSLGGDESIKKQDVWPTKMKTCMDREFVQPGVLLLSWGDFQLGYDYQIQSARRYCQIQEKLGNHITPQAGLDWCYRYFLLDDVVKREDVEIATFGTTLFQNRMGDWTQPRYHDAIDRYFNRCRFSKFRDPYSAWVAERIVSDSSGGHHGVDCALLNSPNELLSIPASGFHETVNAGMIGVYLGRSSKTLSLRHFSRFLRGLTTRLGSKLFWLPWNRFSGNKLFAKRPRQLQRPFLSMEEIPPDQNIMSGDIFHLMKDFRLIVTDTYHVAVNAMVLGTPVLCVYEATPESDRNANMGYREAWRDKRVMLFCGSNQSDLLMPAEDLKNRKRARRKIDHVVDLLADDRTIEHWRNWISQERESERRELDQAINDWLSS